MREGQGRDPRDEPSGGRAGVSAFPVQQPGLLIGSVCWRQSGAKPGDMALWETSSQPPGEASGILEPQGSGASRILAQPGTKVKSQRGRARLALPFHVTE